MKYSISLYLLLFFTLAFSQKKNLAENTQFVEEIKKQNTLLKHITVSYLNSENSCNVSFAQLTDFTSSVNKIHEILGNKTVTPTKTSKPTEKIVEEKVEEKVPELKIKKPSNQTTKIMTIIDDKFPSVGNKLEVVKEKTEVLIYTNESELMKSNGEITSFGKKFIVDLGELLKSVKNYKLYIEIKDSYDDEREKRVAFVEKMKDKILEDFSDLRSRIELVEESNFSTYYNKKHKKMVSDQIKFIIKM
jgi:hypothetical protein